MKARTLPPFVAERREQVLELAERHGATNVRIFGSFARGEARPDSDVDILVSIKPGRSYFDFVALWQDLEELLERKVDVVSERGMSPYLRGRILAEARLL